MRAMEPSWTHIVSAVSTGVTGLIVAVALGIAIWQVVEARQGRRAEALFELSRRWDEPLLAEGRQAAAIYTTPDALRVGIEKARSNPEGDEYYMLVRVPNFFEDLAVMVEDGLASFEDVKRTLGSQVVGKWLHWQPSVAFMRETSGRPTVYEHFEALARRMGESLGMPSVATALEAEATAQTDREADPTLE